MNKFKVTLVALCMMMTVPFGVSAVADVAGKKVVVVSGVAKARYVETNYDLTYKGIDNVLNPAGITPVYQWAEMTYLKTDEEKIAAGDVALANLRAQKPDVVIVLDDDALKFVGARIDDIPVVFGLIYASPQSFGLPKANVTGVVRTSYAVDIWRTANQLLGVKTVALISKTSAPMQGVKQYLSAQADLIEKGSGVRYKDMFLCETFEDWEKAVTSFPYDLIYLADTSRIARDGKEMPRQDLTGWTVDNTQVPVVAASEADVEGGALFSIVTSEMRNGALTAELALEILNGAAPSQEYKKVTQGKLVINVKTAQKYDLTIPYDILSTADRVIE